MDLTAFYSRTAETLSRHGAEAAARNLIGDVSIAAWRRAGFLYNTGTPIWGDNWDALVVLDGCRYDMMARVADEYDWLPSQDAISSRWSVGGASLDWMRETFSEEFADEMQETALVTSNVNTRSFDHLGEKFQYVDEMWRSKWGDSYKTVLPTSVTDHAIHAGRETKADRLIVHYMQPHHPFLTDPHLDKTGGVSESTWLSAWDKLQYGMESRERVLQAYEDNLRCVLSDLPRLFDNLDAETVAITADHGNLIGESGIYGHYQGVYHPSLRTVPWVEVTAEDRQSEIPVVEPAHRSEKVSDSEVESRLEALGYKQ